MLVQKRHLKFLTLSLQQQYGKLNAIESPSLDIALDPQTHHLTKGTLASLGSIDKLLIQANKAPCFRLYMLVYIAIGPTTPN